MSDLSITHASFKFSDDNKTLICIGDWTLAGVSHFKSQIASLAKTDIQIENIDGSQIEHMDTAGALFLHDVIRALSKNEIKIKIIGLDRKFQQLLKLISKEAKKMIQPVPKHYFPNWFYIVGVWAVDKVEQANDFFTFAGELVMIIINSFLNPKRIQWRSIVSAIEISGYQALPIVALMSFLVGVVIAYQLAEQLQVYGANIFIVDVTGVIIFREFGPFVTAIILAGRTSTSFAALLGTMKVNEEIDALQTMGLSPLERLVTPRIIGLLIALPLLAVWADFFGIFGSMVMSKNMLNISFLSYIDRFQQSVALKQFILGLIKTPFFALIIATVGCFQGFQVEMRAESVGLKTTKAAVQSIFLIIVADAAFSVLFSEMGL